MKNFFIKFILLFTDYRRSDKTKVEMFFHNIKIFIRGLLEPFVKYKIVIINTHTQVKYSILTVTLKEIKSSDMNLPDDELDYSWDKLRNSIKRYGLIYPLNVRICNEIDPLTSKTCRYCVKDGNHRITVLKELYPSNYKVKIKIKNSDFTR